MTRSGSGHFALVMGAMVVAASVRAWGAEAPAAEKTALPPEKPAAGKVDAPNKPEAGPADRLAAEQQQVADRYRRLEEVLLRMAEVSRMTDPRRAALLRQAVDESKQRLIGVQFERLVELLQKDQLAPAIAGQGDLDGDLRAILQLLLTESRSERNRSEQARLRDYIKKIAEIINQQQSILGRTAGGGEPKGLADEQNRLANRTGELAKTIKENEEAKPGSAKGNDGSKPGQTKGAPGGAKETPEPKQGKPGEGQRKPGEAQGKPTEAQGKPSEGQGKPNEGQGKPNEGQGKPSQSRGKPAQGQGKPGQTPSKEQSQGDEKDPSEGSGPPQEDQANPARKRLEAARQRMREAEEKLRKAQREGAKEEQEKALEELKQAKADLEKILRQLREEEIEHVLTALEARLAKMLQMQRAVYDATVRLEDAMKKSPGREHEVEAGRLSTREAEIGLEAERALNLLKEDGTSVAFAEALEQMRADIQQVDDRLKAAKVDETTRSIEEDIIAALEEMIQALQKEIQKRERRKGQAPPPGEPQDPPLVDVLAELKMIRALQMRVNTRTARYSKLLGDREQAEHPDLIEALKRLAERQRRIYKITRDLEMGKNQ
ncbi:MAG: hypothetical protein NUV77_13455 [Thermoguttaceae bacterium]|nr:hypothetical protein [Thermoguttaceae bacterium]